MRPRPLDRRPLDSVTDSSAETRPSALPQLALVMGRRCGGKWGGEGVSRLSARLRVKFFSKTGSCRMKPRQPPVSTLPVFLGCSEPRRSSVHSRPSSMLPKTSEPWPSPARGLRGSVTLLPLYPQGAGKSPCTGPSCSSQGPDMWAQRGCAQPLNVHPDDRLRGAV